MFSPSKVNGFGPSWSLPTGRVAYQKRRKTFCLVQSMAFASRIELQAVRRSTTRAAS